MNDGLTGVVGSGGVLGSLVLEGQGEFFMAVDSEYPVFGVILYAGFSKPLVYSTGQSCAFGMTKIREVQVGDKHTFWFKPLCSLSDDSELVTDIMQSMNTGDDVARFFGVPLS